MRTPTKPTSVRATKAKPLTTTAGNDSLANHCERRTGYRGSARPVEAAKFDLASRARSIVRVVQAYLNILRAQDRLDTTNAEITAVATGASGNADVGVVAITDVLEFKRHTTTRLFVASSRG